MERFANNADSSLNGGIDNSTTTIVVADGSPFPSSGDFRLILGTNPDTCEIVIATARTGNTLTVIRGQENTSAQSWADATIVTHIVTAGAVGALRDTLKGKILHPSLETVGTNEDGYALTWINVDGYWAPRPGSPFTVVGNELVTTRTLSVDSAGTVASGHSSSQFYVNGKALATIFTAGDTPLTTARYAYVSDALQTFTVPAGVTQLFIKMWGPGGGSGNYSSGSGLSAGSGGYASGYLSVTPGEVLQLVVGSGGKKSVSTVGNGGPGGWPGGGNGGRGDASAGGGGGFTGVFNTSMTQGNALMIAGGGGGSSGYGGGGGGGAGGGSSGNQGTQSDTGRGGSQVAGGNNGANNGTPAYTVGTAFQGGNAFTDITTSQSNDAGGGGSGYFGGGAGTGDGRAGGGGSGFIHPSRVIGGVSTTGTNGITSAAGALPPNTSDVSYIAGIGVGGGVTGTGLNGGDGYIIIQYGGQTTLNLTSLTFANSAALAAAATDLNVSTIDSGNINLNASGNIGLNPTGGLITLQSSADFTFSHANAVKFSSSGAPKFKIYPGGAVNIGEGTHNDTQAESQSGLTGPLLNISPLTGGSLSTVANQALIYNSAGAITLQGNTETRFVTGTGLRGYFDANGILRGGPSSSVAATIQTSTYPIVGTDYLYLYNASGSTWAEVIAGGNANRAALQVMNSGPGGSATAGVSLFAAGTAHATAEYNGNGIIEQSGAATSGLIFTKMVGNATGFASTGAIWQSGAWTIGRATHNDTSAEAQAGLTGPLLNISSTTGGTLTTTANQALLYNVSGAVALQGNTSVNFRTGTNLVGYFDGSIAGGNVPLRLGNAASSGITYLNSSQPSSASMIFANGTASATAIFNSQATTTRTIISAINNSSGNATGITLQASGTAHTITAFQNMGVIEQVGPNTTAILFSRIQHDETGRVITGRIWQSGAWTIGDATQNDTSTEAQAGLVGPLLNISQITSGSVSSTANQTLVYNNAGVLTLQGHAGHALVANTTTVASATTSKFITSVGRRIATSVKTTSYGITTSDDVIIVGAISGIVTMTLPSAPTAGDTYTVKDQLGNAASFSIIVDGNGNNIDGSSTYVMNTNYQSITVVFANGTWSVI